VPDDWTVRLGFVFDSNTSSNDVVSTVGASDVYGELGVGWNLIEWSFPTSSIAREPLRGTINLDLDGMFFTDENINDVHGRGIFGPSFVFGIPVKYTTPDPRQQVDPTVVENDPVIELLARLGAVVAEVPQFKSKDTDELKSEHNQVLYSADWGLGLDVEFNVPITQKLGYIMARGQINAFFDPNPWFISLGYTIPLSTITSAITTGAAS
jgi:hypothetical protein